MNTGWRTDGDAPTGRTAEIVQERESVQLYNMSECSDAGGNAETLDGSDAPPARIYMPL